MISCKFPSICGARPIRRRSSEERLGVRRLAATHHLRLGSVPTSLLRELLIEVVFGDILNRLGLDRRTRLFAVIGAIAAQSADRATLRWYVRAALSSGASAQEVTEVLIQTAAFAGLASPLKCWRSAVTYLAPARTCMFVSVRVSGQASVFFAGGCD